MIKIISILCLILLVISCGSKSAPSKRKSVVERYILMGDPKEIIAGTKLNRESFITVDNFKTYNDFALLNLKLFESHQAKRKPVQDVHEGQEHEELDAVVEFSKYTFRQINSQQMVYRIDEDEDIEIEFNIVDDKFVPSAFSYYGSKLEIDQVYHYSQTPDLSAFSLLFLIKEGTHSYLISATFGKEVNFIENKVGQTQYNFTFGNEFKVRWRKNLNLALCSIDKSTHDYLNQTIQDSIRAWSDHASLPISYKVLDDYPPISDLNTQCIYMVNAYLEEQDYDYVVRGTTFMVGRYLDSSFIDGDIIFWKKEFQKYQSSLKLADIFEQKTTKGMTIPHEIGHVLGLDHQFDGTKSIMSYEDKECDPAESVYNSVRLCRYDAEAIRYLYTD